MTTCLAPHEIARYRAGALATVEELLAVEAHLDTCPTCRNALLAAVGSATDSLQQKLMTGLDAPACPEPSVLARYASGTADPTDVELVETHVEDCPRCTADLAARRATPAPPAPDAVTLPQESTPPVETDAAPLTHSAIQMTVPDGSEPLMETLPAAEPAPSVETVSETEAPEAVPALQARWRRLRSRFVEPTARRRWVPVAMGLATAAAVLAAIIYRQKTVTLQRQVAGLKTENRKRQAQLAQQVEAQTQLWMQRLQDEARERQELTAQVQDLQGRLDRTSQQVVRSVMDRRDWEMALATAAQPPQEISLLAAGASQVRSGSDTGAPGITLLSPIATYVATDHPAFRWKPVPGATDYSVHLTDETDPQNTVPPSRLLSRTEWTAPTALLRGHVYTWGVTARKSGVMLESALARFRVLDAVSAAAIQRFHRENSGLPLTLGIRYTQFGLLDDAEQVLKKVPATDSRFAAAQKLLHDLSLFR